MQKIFGTDGARGIYPVDITPGLVFDMGRALALYLKNKKNNNILIAKDTRLSSDILLTSFASGCMSMGAMVTYMGHCTTPCLAYVTREKKYTCGVMITASHNSYEYNGVKIFKSNGEKLGPKEEKVLTKIFNSLDSFAYSESNNCGKLKIKYNLKETYIKHLKNIIKDKYYDMSVAFDCANGVSYKIIQKLFDDNFRQLFFVNTSQNGKNVNHKCGATDTQSLGDFVVKNKLDLGFAFDGDADRVVMVDGSGKTYDGDDIVYNLALYLKQKGKLRGSCVVGTSMTNLGLEKALEKEDILLKRVEVGDKYIVDSLKQNGYVLGGEKAGHIIPYDYTNTGDGVLTSLIMLDAISKNGIKKVVNYPQQLINIPVSKELKDSVMTDRDVLDFVEGVKRLNPDYRIVVRPSGTENKIRVMVEGICEIKVNEIVSKVCEFITQKYL